MPSPPRAESVTIDGVADGFVPPLAWAPERTPTGETRLVVSAPPAELPRLFSAMLHAMRGPFSVLYRRKVDRKLPKPDEAPPRDFVSLEVPLGRLEAAIDAVSALIFGDARAELWIRGDLGEQLVLDQDGLLYGYPDDPSWRDALAAAGVPESEAQTLAERDYVKHWYHPEHDALEAEWMARLRMTEVRHRPA